MQINNEWDKLTDILIGRTYPPEYFEFVQCDKTREVIQKITSQTANTLNQLEKFLKKDFNINVIRTDLVDYGLLPDESLPVPPLQPRNHMFFLQNTLYCENNYWLRYYTNVKDPSWPVIGSLNELLESPYDDIINELYDCFDLEKEIPYIQKIDNQFKTVFDYVKSLDSNVIRNRWADGGMIYRCNNNLYLGMDGVFETYQEEHDRVFGEYNRKYLFSEGHVDGIMSVVTEGLVFVKDDPEVLVDWKDVFPKDWEVIKFPTDPQNRQYKDYLKQLHRGWYIDKDVGKDIEIVNTIDSLFKNWTGNCFESHHDINLLVIDRKNVVFCQENLLMMNELEKRGINCHLIDLPYLDFWDGGLHCTTVELNRQNN